MFSVIYLSTKGEEVKIESDVKVKQVHSIEDLKKELAVAKFNAVLSDEHLDIPEQVYLINQENLNDSIKDVLF